MLGPAWGGTHWLLRESGVWKDRNTDEVNLARQRRDVLLRPRGRARARQGGAAVRAGRRGRSTGSPEQRRDLFELQYAATRLRERSVLGALALVLAANGVVFWWLADQASSGSDAARARW